MRFGRTSVLSALFAIGLAGCTVNFLSGYDAKTDEIVTSMQKAYAAHSLTVLEGDPQTCPYSANRGYYRQAQLDAGTLLMRAEAIAKNDPTIAQVNDLKQSLLTLEKLDRLAEGRRACLSGAELAPIDRANNSIFGAILKLELAKLRGTPRPRM